MLAEWRDRLERDWLAQPGKNGKSVWGKFKKELKKFSGGDSK
jgi:hypothetical protein